MEQFVVVAIAHFLALLIPGVDFFLILRATLTSGWRNATGVCVGIAAANGLLIAAAFSGLSLVSDAAVLAGIQIAGGAFLVFIGIAFIKSRDAFDSEQPLGAERRTWLRNVGLGMASGLLNPKNVLFYLSLATVLSGASPITLVAYGVWMFLVVLLWDLCVAIAFGSHRLRVALGRVIPWLSKIAGGFLVLLGVGMVVSIAPQLIP